MAERAEKSQRAAPNWAPVDVEANRRARKWTRGEQVRRVLWAAVWPLFRLSPRPMWSWRRMLLRLFGAEIGPEAQVFPTAVITMPWNLRIGRLTAIGDGAILYALGPISIGDRVTVSQRAHLCAGTHDWRSPDRALLKPPIAVENDVWICTEAFIGPGIRVGQGAIVGARAVAVRDVAPRATVVGNPAREIRRG